MPKICSVCSHERREEIDYALLAGESTRAVSEAFGLTYPTVKGHRRSAHHLVGRTPPRRTSSHTAATLLTRIEECLDDHEAMRDLRIAVGTLPPGERRLLVEGLRLRTDGRGEVEEHVPAILEVA